MNNIHLDMCIIIVIFYFAMFLSCVFLFYVNFDFNDSPRMSSCKMETVWMVFKVSSSNALQSKSEVI